MSLGDLLLSVSQAMAFGRGLITSEPLEVSDPYCGISFFLGNVGSTSTVFWYFCMALNLFMILRGRSELFLLSLRPYQHAIIWGYALITTIPALIRRKYGVMEGVADLCYFVDPRDPHRLLFYGPLALCLFCCFCLFLYAVFFFIYRRFSFRGKSLMVLCRLGFMILVFGVTWGLALYSRIEDAFGRKDLYNFQEVALTLSGFCNFIVWGLTNQRVMSFCGGSDLMYSDTQTFGGSSSESFLTYKTHASAKFVPRVPSQLNSDAETVYNTDSFCMTDREDTFHSFNLQATIF